MFTNVLIVFLMLVAAPGFLSTGFLLAIHDILGKHAITLHPVRMPNSVQLFLIENSLEDWLVPGCPP